MYPKWYSRSAALLITIVLLSLVTVFLLGSVAQAEESNGGHTINSSPTPTIQTPVNPTPTATIPTPTPTVYSPLTISGRVVDENGAPLRFVQVSSQPYLGQSSDRTDDQGYYTLRNVQPGTYQVLVYAYSPWYEPETVTVTVPPSAVNVNFKKLPATVTPASPTPTNTPTATGTPIVVDSGFRLNEHAWRFPNRGFVPEQKHVVGAFGEDNARRFAGVVFSDGTGGSCFGFAVTASLLVHGNSLGMTPPVTPFVNTYAVLDPGENIVNGDPYFEPSVVADYIIQSHYRQFSTENWDEMKMSHRMSLDEKINAIKQSVDDRFNSDPVIIALQNRSGDCGGHAVVPISYTVSFGGRTEVAVYDPNHPVGMNEHQTIIFDENNGSWSYTPRGENVSYGSSVVCTNANNQHLESKIEVLHATTYNKPTNPPLWRMPPGNIWIEVTNWVVSVRDAIGNVLGDVDGEIVENIPDSFVFTPLDQLGGNPKSWYIVQTSAPVTATIQYNNSTDDAVTLFAQKAVFDVGLAKSRTATDTLVIDSSGGAVSLFGGGSRSITTTRLLTGTEQIFTLNMQKSDQVRVQILDDGSLKFFTATGQEVTLTLIQHGRDGEASYQLSLPHFNSGDAQIIVPEWQNHNATVGIDVGNDGTIDSTQNIEEEMTLQAVYLPLIKR